jgi:predicted alpha/beta hydrolase
MGKVESISFKSKDGYSLTGKLYSPNKPAHATILVNSGTGIPQGLYTRFAKYASENVGRGA